MKVGDLVSWVQKNKGEWVSLLVSEWYRALKVSSPLVIMLDRGGGTVWPMWALEPVPFRL